MTHIPIILIRRTTTSTVMAPAPQSVMPLPKRARNLRAEAAAMPRARNLAAKNITTSKQHIPLRSDMTLDEMQAANDHNMRTDKKRTR